MKYAAHVDRILLCETCKLREKSITVPEIINLSKGLFFIGTPCIFLLCGWRQILHKWPMAHQEYFYMTIKYNEHNSYNFTQI